VLSSLFCKQVAVFIADGDPSGTIHPYGLVDDIVFTLVTSFPLHTFTFFYSDRWTRCDNSSRSTTRNKDRPAATTTNGSTGAEEVQAVGTDCSRPFLSWNHTLSSPQFWR